jgi:hypothetical protein
MKRLQWVRRSIRDAFGALKVFKDNLLEATDKKERKYQPQICVAALC